jgi:hypothetical protein
VLAGSILNSHRTQIVGLAAKSRLPAIYPYPAYVEDSGLMTYSVSFTDLFRRAATYVDKILKGAKPADLPVEQPTKFELVINLKTAKQIGLTIPPNVLARADRVIKWKGASVKCRVIGGETHRKRHEKKVAVLTLCALPASPRAESTQSLPEIPIPTATAYAWQWQLDQRKADKIATLLAGVSEEPLSH